MTYRTIVAHFRAAWLQQPNAYWPRLRSARQIIPVRFDFVTLSLKN
jgi:hypothetical protein